MLIGLINDYKTTYSCNNVCFVGYLRVFGSIVTFKDYFSMKRLYRDL